eukprot:scaffold901_cov167-Amphora_coffeaeformis.AAC.11
MKEKWCSEKAYKPTSEEGFHEFWGMLRILSPSKSDELSFRQELEESRDKIGCTAESCLLYHIDESLFGIISLSRQVLHRYQVHALAPNICTIVIFDTPAHVGLPTRFCPLLPSAFWCPLTRRTLSHQLVPPLPTFRSDHLL